MNSGNCGASDCYAVRRIDAVTAEYFEEIKKYRSAYDKTDDLHTKALYSALVTEKASCVRRLYTLKTDIILNELICI